MTIRKIRIIHVEDDWEQFRTLPNNLFDMVYVRSDPEVKITVDFEEIEPDDDHRTPSGAIQFCYLWRAFVGDPAQILFEYYFVDSIESLHSIAVEQDDFFIVDIMQAGEDGMPVSVLEKARDFIDSSEVRPMKVLYFSAYPEYIEQKSLPIDGFDKSKIDNLIFELQDAIFSQFPSFSVAQLEHWKLRPRDIGMPSRLD